MAKHEPQCNCWCPFCAQVRLDLAKLDMEIRVLDQLAREIDQAVPCTDSEWREYLDRIAPCEGTGSPCG